MTIGFPMRTPGPVTLADESDTIDGYSYRVSVEVVPGGFRAWVHWIGAPVGQRVRSEDVPTPTFHNARAAILEAHSLARESILALRAPSAS